MRVTRWLIVVGAFVLTETKAGALPPGYDWVQWQESAGGNGHYYALTAVDGPWPDAEAEAVSVGGHLATIESAAEDQWLFQVYCQGTENRWIGLYQDINDPGYVEPDGAWKWASGEAIIYTHWKYGEPNNYHVIPGGEQWGEMISSTDFYPGFWNDRGADVAFQGIIELAACPAKLLDVWPGFCPNPLNRQSAGLLPVALLGTAAFDVMAVDGTTLRLSRADGIGGNVTPLTAPPGAGLVIGDVGSPSCDICIGPCGCCISAVDGISDLRMEFLIPDIVSALELAGVPKGTLVEIAVSGQLLDGSPFSATDCVVLAPIGDVDGDTDVDLLDFNRFQACFNGPNKSPKSSNGCNMEDYDMDRDVDLADYSRFQSCYNGPNRPSPCD